MKKFRLEWRDSVLCSAIVKAKSIEEAEQMFFDNFNDLDVETEEAEFEEDTLNVNEVV